MDQCGNHPREKITLKKLKLALENPLVGRPCVAQNMVEKFAAAKRPLANSRVASKRTLATKTILTPNMPLSENRPVPAKRTLVAKGTLVAKRPVSGNRANRTLPENRPMAAKSLDGFLPEKEQLVDLYSVHKEVPADSWPPAGTATFINLVLINKNKLGTRDYDYSVRGNVDYIIASKEKIEYDEVFGQYQSGALILIEGRPGSGKTTLVHRVTRDWATTRNMLISANWVFLIPLRSLAKGNDESLTDILAIFYRHKEDREKVFSDVRRSNGEGVCFIIDGLDEYEPQNESKSVIYAILQKDYLPKAMVIVASRPVATATLCEKPLVTKQIGVLGFTQLQIFEYIDQFPFTADVSNLRAYLNSHHNILHMCYLPVHAAMICYLYEHDQGHMPQTETKIYEYFTRYIVLRKLRLANKKAQIQSLEDICGENKEYFRKVCRLAFDMTIHSRQVVHKCDTEVVLSHDTGPHDAPSLGLITIDLRAQHYGLDNTYTFLHLTFQEYLAALHIATLEEDEQTRIVTLYAGEEHMRNVWKFYSAMVTFERKVDQIELIMTSADHVYKIKCAFESQQVVVCDHAIQQETSVLLSGFTLTASDLTAIGYVISTTSLVVTKLDMSACGLNADHVRVFLRQVSNKSLKRIPIVHLGYNNIAAALAEALKFCDDLQILHLGNNNIGADGAAALAEALKSCNNLQTLYLSDNIIGADGAVALAEALTSCNDLRRLSCE